MGSVILNSEGDEITMESAKKTGTYIDTQGVGRWLNVGDPLPAGWTLAVEESAPAEETKAPVKGKRGPAANKAKAPAEDK